MSEKSNRILVNCDMGEWDAPHLEPVDSSIMPLIDLCNIACGGHAGSQEIMLETIDLAMHYNVKVGAHPGYEDRQNFGRKRISIPKGELSEMLERQLSLFLNACASKNVPPFHVKTHGALYHDCNQNEQKSEILLDVFLKLCPDLVLLVAPLSILEKLAKESGIYTMTESFIDRRYNDDLGLVSRSESNAVIQNVDFAVEQFRNLQSGFVITTSGKKEKIESQTACIHGDNPKCLDILTSIRSNE